MKTSDAVQNKSNRTAELFRAAFTRRGVVRIIAWFLISLVLANYTPGLGLPFLGLSAVSAVSGLSGGVAAVLGTLLGVRAHPASILAVCGLFAARLVLSLWLSDSRERLFPKRSTRRTGTRTTRVLRHGNIGANDAEAETLNAVHTASPRTEAAKSSGTRRKHASPRGFPAVLRIWAAADTRLFREELPLRLAFAAVFALFAGVGSSIGEGLHTEYVLRVLITVFLCPLAAYGLYAAAERNMRYSPMRQAGQIMTLALCASATTSVRILAIPALSITGISLGEMLAFAAAVVSGIGWGAAQGALYGASCGLCVSPLYAGAYAIAGITAGIAGQYAPAAAAALSAAAGTIWSLAVGGFSGLSATAPSFLTAAAILAPLYSIDKVRRFLTDALPSPLPLTDLRRRERESLAETALWTREKRLGEMAAHLGEIGDALRMVAERMTKPSADEAADWCREAVGMYCARCPRREDCTETHYDSYAAMLGKMARSALRTGQVDATDVPLFFAGKCAAMSRILDEVNLTCARRMGERRTENQLLLTAEDYAFMGRLLAESAQAEEEDGRLDEALSARVAAKMAAYDCAAGRIAVYGVRHRRVYAHDLHLAETRLGGEELRAVFSECVGVPLSAPVFTLDGPVLSMELRSEPRFRCVCGTWAESGEAIRTGGVPESDMLCNDAVCNDAMRSNAVDSGGFPGMAEFTPAMLEEASGDTICTFENGERTYMLLSDGMGSGRMAALTSELTAMFLDKMLSVGAGLELTLRMLNHILRANAGEISTTVDLCEVDRVSGEVKFVKSGAAPSYVVRGDSLFRLQSKTAPVGILRALDAELIRFSVEPGDVIVMVSDGVARSFEDCPWLLELLSQTDSLRNAAPEESARRIVMEAARRGATDDATAGVIQIA